MTNTLKNEVLKMLEANASARERKNRYHAVWFVLHERHQKDTIDKQTFMDIGPEIVSIIRLINFFQKLYPQLRGTDYGDKKKLVQQTQIDLGYEVGYHSDIKKGKFYEPQEDIYSKKFNDEDY